MFEKYNEGAQEPYPATQEEAEVLVTQMINMIHSEEVSKGLAQVIQNGTEDPINTIAQIGAQLAVKTIKTLEQQTGRDILPETELGVLAIAIEELATISANFGLQVDEAMVSNMVQIGSDMFNQMIQPAQQGPPQGPQQAMQGGPQGPQAMQGPQGGMV